MQYHAIAGARPDPEYSVGENLDGLPIDAMSGMIICSLTDEHVGIHPVRIIAINRFSTSNNGVTLI